MSGRSAYVHFESALSKCTRYELASGALQSEVSVRVDLDRGEHMAVLVKSVPLAAHLDAG